MVDYLSISYEELKKKDKFNSIAICAKYDEAKEIIAKLVCSGYGIASIDRFDSEEYGRYYDEYVISLLEDQIWCEPAKRNGKYIFVEADVVYIFDNCNSKIIPKIEADEVYEVEIGNEYDDCDSDCKKCDCQDETTTSTSYEVNGKAVDKETYEKAIENIKDIEEKYLDGVRDMLLRYCEIQDEMNEWRKLLN